MYSMHYLAWVGSMRLIGMNAMKTADELKGSDIIDTRDIIEAARELRAEIEADPRELDDDESALLDFDDDGPNKISEYSDGNALIRESYFEEYAQDLAEYIGAISSDLQWPMYCIDWERAARDLAVGYSSVTFLGYDYYVRA